jgi:hypothetical protein
MKDVLKRALQFIVQTVKKWIVFTPLSAQIFVTRSTE